MPCSSPRPTNAAGAWCESSRALAVFEVLVHKAAASSTLRDHLHSSMLSFWEGIAANVLQPEAPLQVFAADALDAHHKGGPDSPPCIPVQQRWQTSSEQ